MSRIKEITYCGLFCGACPSYLRGTCYGCRSEDRSQNRKSKWSCKIRKCCIQEKKVAYCGICKDFPCKEIERKLINSNIKDPRFNYRHQIPHNIEEIRKVGLEKWARNQVSLWNCSECGGKVTFYNYTCQECGKECDPQK